MFQQLIAKASDDVKRKLEQERPDLVDQIQNSVAEVTGALQSKFGPASRSYFKTNDADDHARLAIICSRMTRSSASCS